MAAHLRASTKRPIILYYIIFKLLLIDVNRKITRSNRVEFIFLINSIRLLILDSDCAGGKVFFMLCRHNNIL